MCEQILVGIPRLVTISVDDLKKWKNPTFVSHTFARRSERVNKPQRQKTYMHQTARGLASYSIVVVRDEHRPCQRTGQNCRLLL